MDSFYAFFSKSKNYFYSENNKDTVNDNEISKETVNNEISKETVNNNIINKETLNNNISKEKYKKCNKYEKDFIECQLNQDYYNLGNGECDDIYYQLFKCYFN